MPFISKKKPELEKKLKCKAEEYKARGELNDAIQCHYELLLKLYLTNPLDFKTLFKANRFIVGSAILGIYYIRKSSTFKDVKRFCISNDLFSSNSLDSFLLFLRVGGRLEVYRDSEDKRKLNYKPTPKALAETQRMINTMIIPCAMLTDSFDLEFYQQHKNFVPEFFRTYAEITLNRLFIHDMVPGSAEFLSRDGGHMMMFNLYLETIKQQSLTIKFNILKSAFCCGVSRSHIRRCLQAAEEIGLLKIEEGANDLTLSPTFIEMVKDYFCIYLATVEHGLAGMR